MNDSAHDPRTILLQLTAQLRRALLAAGKQGDIELATHLDTCRTELEDILAAASLPKPTRLNLAIARAEIALQKARGIP